MKLRNLLIASLGLMAAAGGASIASAATHFDHHHPLRAEENHRLDRLEHRVRHEHREAELGRYEARRLRHHMHMARLQERDFAHPHGGRISHREQAGLNHEETAIGDRGAG